MAEQISMFSVLSQEDNSAEYEKLRIQALKSKRKRYKNPTYTKYYKEYVHIDGTKTDAEVKWGEMNKLYIELANRFPYPLAFNQCDDIVQVDDDTSYIDTGIIRTFKICYHKEKYIHKGDDGKFKEFLGEDFFYNFAEIIGSENLGINERLFLHYWLIEFLDEGYPIEKLNLWIDNLVNMCKQGWTAELLIVLLINLRCKNYEIQN